MQFLCSGLSLALLSLCTSALGGAAVQKAGLVLPPDAISHRDAVEAIFVKSYENYKKFAFGHDDLQPISATFNDGRNGWGATIIDAMSTMHIMGLNDFFAEAVEFASKIDFSESQVNETVSVFETTIRYVGGLLSAYELSDNQFPALVAKAKQVTDKMVQSAWLDITTQDIPYGELNFTNNLPVLQTSNIAEAGTLDLEWGTLSKHTGNDTYRDLTERAVKHIASLVSPLPGLAAQGIDPATGQFVGGYVTWGGGSDSYFEYLIKYARLTNTDDPIFADTWHTAVDSSIQNLLRTSTVGDHLYLADFDDSRTIRHVGSHLACFYGGNWILGGKLLNNQTIFDIALTLNDACWNTYASDVTGIGPEAFAYISSDGNFTGGDPITPEQLAFYDKHGFYVTDSDYILRPEVLESNFYAWRATGDTKYLDRAASAINSFNTFLQVKDGFAGLTDVNDPSADKIDDMESFWFAEVLKYLYLTFDDPDHISLNDYVFNTEAHPFKAPQALASYGSGTVMKATGTFKLKSGGPLPAISPNAFLPKTTDGP